MMDGLINTLYWPGYDTTMHYVAIESNQELNKSLKVMA